MVGSPHSSIRTGESRQGRCGEKFKIGKAGGETGRENWQRNVEIRAKMETRRGAWWKTSSVNTDGRSVLIHVLRAMPSALQT